MKLRFSLFIAIFFTPLAVLPTATATNPLVVCICADDLNLDSAGGRGSGESAAMAKEFEKLSAPGGKWRRIA